MNSAILRFVMPVVFYEITNVDCVCTGLTQLYLLVEYNVFLHKIQLHVSALDNGHLQVVQEILIKQLYKTYMV